MIKYLREKITGCTSADATIDGNVAPVQKTHSPTNLNDVVSMSSNSNSNDAISTDQVLSRMEKFNAAAVAATSGHSSVRRPVGSSSPIIIPKKAPYSNTTPASSSSYTSVPEQTSSLTESTIHPRTELDESSSEHGAFPSLPSSSQKLKHEAARDRILLKNKRQQPSKHRLSTLRETDDPLMENSIDLLSTETNQEEREPSPVRLQIQPVQLPVVKPMDLGLARAALRASARPRDHSADNVLLTTNASTLTAANAGNAIHRSTSFRQPQEIRPRKHHNLVGFQLKKDEHYNDQSSEEEPTEPLKSSDRNEEKSSDIKSKSSSHEHIYDNLDLFKQHRLNKKVEIEVPSNNSLSASTHRLRPMSMISTDETEKSSTNEFENVFNKLKKRASIRETKPALDHSKVEEPIEPVAPSPAIVPPPMVKKTIEPTTTTTTQPVNRRKTVGGIHLPVNNKVATEESKPTPSWVDIAKQRQNKLQSVTKETDNHSDQKSDHSSEVDHRSNRKSMYESVITRQGSPLSNGLNIERDSIRALKAGNPNRINNLIQFFDK